MKKIFASLWALMVLTVFGVASAAGQEASPEWVGNLPQAGEAQ